MKKSENRNLKEGLTSHKLVPAEDNGFRSSINFF